MPAAPACGGSPSYTQRILQRIIRNEWDLLRMNQRLVMKQAARKMSES
jgi:hypothetical protein